MDTDDLIREPKYIRSCLRELNDGSIIFTKAAKVYLPKMWIESDLINLSDPVSVVCVFAIVIGDRYGVSTINSMMSTEPSKIGYETIDKIDYIVFSYSPEDKFMLNKSLVKRDNLPYKLFTFLFDKGKIPWYLNYTDVSQIYDSSKKYADVNFNLPHSVFEMIASVIARNEGDKSKFYRHGDWKKKPVYIPLRSVQFAASNTTAKLIGAYWSEGLSSALVNPSDRREIIEDLLRS